MKLIVNNSALLLDRWQTVELVDAAGATAVVEKGCVWLTMAGDRRDVVLGTGQSFKVANNGRTLVHAERPTALRIIDGPTLRERLVATLKNAREAIDRWAVASIERPRPAAYY